MLKSPKMGFSKVLKIVFLVFKIQEAMWLKPLLGQTFAVCFLSKKYSVFFHLVHAWKTRVKLWPLTVRFKHKSSFKETRVLRFHQQSFSTACFSANKACVWPDRQAWSSWARQQSALERQGWRDGAGRRARDEQSRTLGSCCSQQQVQSREGGRKRSDGRRGGFCTSVFVFEKKKNRAWRTVGEGCIQYEWH